MARQIVRQIAHNQARVEPNSFGIVYHMQFHKHLVFSINKRLEIRMLYTRAKLLSY